MFVYRFSVRGHFSWRGAPQDANGGNDNGQSAQSRAGPSAWDCAVLRTCWGWGWQLPDTGGMPASVFSGWSAPTVRWHSDDRASPLRRGQHFAGLRLPGRRCFSRGSSAQCHAPLPMAIASCGGHRSAPPPRAALQTQGRRVTRCTVNTATLRLSLGGGVAASLLLRGRGLCLAPRVS